MLIKNLSYFIIIAVHSKCKLAHTCFMHKHKLFPEKETKYVFVTSFVS